MAHMRVRISAANLPLSTPLILGDGWRRFGTAWMVTVRLHRCVVDVIDESGIPWKDTGRGPVATEFIHPVTGIKYLLANPEFVNLVYDKMSKKTLEKAQRPAPVMQPQVVQVVQQPVAQQPVVQPVQQAQ